MLLKSKRTPIREKGVLPELFLAVVETDPKAFAGFLEAEQSAEKRKTGLDYPKIIKEMVNAHVKVTTQSSYHPLGEPVEVWNRECGPKGLSKDLVELSLLRVYIINGSDGISNMRRIQRNLSVGTLHVFTSTVGDSVLVWPSQRTKGKRH